MDQSIIYRMKGVRQLLRAGLVLSIFFGVSACRAEPEETPTLFWTPLPPSPSLPPLTAPSPDPLPRASIQPGYCDNASQFLEDITVPDGTTVEAGKPITKIWAVQNIGSCDWGPGYFLARVGTDPLQGPEQIALYPARSGADAVWKVELVAPLEPGNYVSRWQAQDPDGVPFGDVVYVLVVVPTPTPIPSPSPSPTR
jgi:hypothetical protein